MIRFALLILISVTNSIYAINRPVYKIVLTQKGYAQSLQYDVETPPLKEFTFCTWIRVYEFKTDQTIFTYVANRNHRVMRLWLDTGGQQMHLSVNNKALSGFHVDIAKNVWKHLCLSYQSDFGAWAIYLDSRLASCNSAQSLYGYVFPGGGSVIIGYGTGNNGVSNGFEGEIFGSNMILVSTIQRNFTSKNYPTYEQRAFVKNKLRDLDNYMRYIVLNDLKTEQVGNNFEIEIINATSTTPSPEEESDEKEMIETSTYKNTYRNTSADQIEFWRILNQSFHSKKVPLFVSEQPGSSTINLSTISEFETPPPVHVGNFFDKTEFNSDKTNSKTNDETFSDAKDSSLKMVPLPLVPSEIETPPPVEKAPKVYGQWTSSKFAGTVLNYLKSINFQGKDKNLKKVPPTIPLNKLSDSYPYANDLKMYKARPPSNFGRKNIIEKRNDVVKRDRQINVQILENDLRSNILKMHFQIKPKDVDVSHRSEPPKQMDHRFYRSAIYDNDKSESHEDEKRKTKINKSVKNQKKYVIQQSRYNHRQILPFVRSLEYTVDEHVKHKNETTTQSNSKSLSNGNKWHNVKSYNNDFTPRKIKIDSNDNSRYPSIRLKYKYDKERILDQLKDPRILDGRKLALEVSNNSDNNKNVVSIFKYNHGFLPNHAEKHPKEQRSNSKRNLSHNISFDKQVKLGDVLNERYLIGNSETQRKMSFEGGHEHIPDINIYRSDLDKNGSSIVPPSLGPRVCKDVELYDRVLYVQPDESIDMSHIMSPLKTRNVAIDFIIQNYKRCSLKESTLQNDPRVFIDWNETPVRLFGGALPVKTTDLCGFF